MITVLSFLGLIAYVQGQCAGEIKTYQTCLLEGKNFIYDQIHQEKLQTDYCFHKSRCGNVDQDALIHELFPQLFETIHSMDEILDVAVPNAHPHTRTKRGVLKEKREERKLNKDKTEKKEERKKSKGKKEGKKDKTQNREEKKAEKEEKRARKGKKAKSERKLSDNEAKSEYKAVPVPLDHGVLPEHDLQRACEQEFQSQMVVCTYGNFADFVPTYKNAEFMDWPRPSEYGYVQKVGCSLYDRFHCHIDRRGDLISCLQNIGYVVPNEATCDLPEILPPSNTHALRLDPTVSGRTKRTKYVSALDLSEVPAKFFFTAQQREQEERKQEFLSFGQLLWPDMKCGVKRQCLAEMSQQCQNRLFEMRDNACWCANNKLQVINKLNCLADPNLSPVLKDKVVINLLNGDLMDMSLGDSCKDPCSEDNLRSAVMKEKTHVTKLRGFAAAIAQKRRI